jgi:peptide/nickel transport system ATP-binding protein/oligopeptide transport system ATP-binding protein
VSSEPDALLSIESLATHFFTDDGVVRAVDGVTLTLRAGEVLGIVGESGSGKSVTSLSILRLIASPPGRIVSGKMLFTPKGEAPIDLATASEDAMRRVRGDRIAMIFQDPMTSLNPYLTVGEQLAEVLELHRKMKRAEAKKKSIEMLASVGIPAPEQRFDDYPHHLSGGMRQRVMIAMALLCDPALLIADEPTTALDVTIQAQILELMRALKDEKKTSILLITHDLGVIAKMADRVAVMYAGRVVEEASAETLFVDPRHPYTLGLLKSVPRLDDEERGRLEPIPGAPPSLAHVPPGCAFHPRCAFAEPRCKVDVPVERLVIASDGEHRVRCHVESVRKETR